MKKIVYILIIGFYCMSPCVAFAHCDALDGPLVKDAREALETGDVNAVLKWVPKKDEPAVKKALEEALEYKKLSPKLQEVADTSFFEAVIRLHKAGEGRSYEGVKPAGITPPVISQADKAISTGSSKILYGMMGDLMYKELNRKFENVILKKNFKKDDVEAGREYVKAYTDLVHYVEYVSGEAD